jgi:nitronate monooxygenase
VQPGTAFILCPDSSADAACRANLKSERAAVTAVTAVTALTAVIALTAVRSGRPARGIVNRLIAHGEAEGSPPWADYRWRTTPPGS